MSQAFDVRRLPAHAPQIEHSTMRNSRSQVRFMMGAFLLAHGFAHLVGLAGAWQLNAGVPHKTTLLAGRIDLGEDGYEG